jgi:hypothetical protein
MTEIIVVVDEYEIYSKAEPFHSRKLHKEVIAQEVL